MTLAGTNPDLNQAHEDAVSHYLCIGCPMGCRLEVEEQDGEIVEVRGFSCRRGEQYAKQEHTAPRRMVTTTVEIENGIWSRIPVKTEEAIPKERVTDLCEALHHIRLQAPIERGATVMSDVFGTGVNVVTSRSMTKA